MEQIDTTYDPMLPGPIRLRISDGYRHAENFEATTVDDFGLNLLDAINRFREWQVNQYPPYQTIKREQAKRLPRLSLHMRDTFYEVARSPLKPYWVMVKRAGMLPVVSVEAWTRDGGKTMWAGVIATLNHCEQLAKFLGFHPSGEDQLGEFLKRELQ